MQIPSKKGNIRQAATTPGTSSGTRDELVKTTTTSRFEGSFQKRAEERRVSVEVVLEGDIELFRSSTYPGPDCLGVEEMCHYVATGKIATEDLEHIGVCETCAGLVEAAQPKEDGVKSLVEQLRCEVPLVEGSRNGARDDSDGPRAMTAGGHFVRAANIFEPFAGC